MEVNPLRSAAHIEASTLPLERVATSTQLSPQAKLNEASRAFEALLLRQILQESQRPVFKSKYVSNSTTDEIYRDQVVNQLAESISKSGSLGLGKSLAQELHSREGSPKSATAAGSPAVKGGILRSSSAAGMRTGIPPNKMAGSMAGGTLATTQQGTVHPHHLARKAYLQSPKHD